MNYIKKLTVSLMLLMAVTCVYSQERPKLVVGIVVDQMRWDYLYRYYDRYAANGGFKRLMNNGFNCQNTMINYIPSFTAVGHSSIYTGSVPSIHGITGNSFVIQQTGTLVSAVRDDSVRAVGTDNQKAGQVSPKNLHTTTITDELELATNFRELSIWNFSHQKSNKKYLRKFDLRFSFFSLLEHMFVLPA